ncbi:signal recognition particle receptor subunit alpha [Eudromia elegans]
MLDFFTIFSKGGLVLWCFPGVRGPPAAVTAPVNALVRSVLLQERGGSNAFTHEALTLKYKLDNQFELVFVVGYQKILTLTYVDKLLDDVHRAFRDKYRTAFQRQGALGLLGATFDFHEDFARLLREAEEAARARAPAAMKTFEQSQKSQKSVRCLVEPRGGDKGKEKGKGKKGKGARKEGGDAAAAALARAAPGDKAQAGDKAELSQAEVLQRNREEFFRRHQRAGERASKSPKAEAPRDKGKKPRVWELGNANAKALDYSDGAAAEPRDGTELDAADAAALGEDGAREPGRLYDLEYESEEEPEEEKAAAGGAAPASARKGGLGGMFGMLRGLVGSKSLTRHDMEPVLEKMKEHLIAKNVAAEIAAQLCESVAKKLEGKVMGTFTTVTSTVKQALQEALVQILQPQRRVDVLRDVLEAQRRRRPYVVTFCGVNGVGKSTNLAKISFWLLENGFSVLIAACDTFRAGAVEQLRTHARRLHALHPPRQPAGRPMVQLYEKGYGKDAAGIAMEAIAFARNQGFDVVLVDTAGRMQDNAPLMTALAKLIAVNAPDLVLFVGEALVGNEAVDQLVKFNKALADHSAAPTPRLIDGIVLTKFDTIDDKVGAAISMTYITSKPIVFVGTGQTYRDLRSLNAKAVVAALMKA